MKYEHPNSYQDYFIGEKQNIYVPRIENSQLSIAPPTYCACFASLIFDAWLVSLVHRDVSVVSKISLISLLSFLSHYSG